MDISIASTATTFSEDVADFAVGLLIDVLRKIFAADWFIRNGLWPVNMVYPLSSKVMSLSSCNCVEHIVVLLFWDDYYVLFHNICVISYYIVLSNTIFESILCLLSWSLSNDNAQLTPII